MEVPREVLEYVLRRKGRGGVHGIEHSLRVLKWAYFIGRAVGADLDVLTLASLLHDISRDEEDHALASAAEARKLLLDLGYPRGFAEKVYLAIRDHSYSGGRKAQTIEAMVLSDADKLDALGYVGVARVFQYSGEHGRTIEESLAHFREKILRLRGLMYFEVSRAIAEELTWRVLEFLRGIEDEVRMLESMEPEVDL